MGFPLHKPYIQLIQVSTSILGTWNVWSLVIDQYGWNIIECLDQGLAKYSGTDIRLDTLSFFSADWMILDGL